ncbi:MAG: DUF1932 domain-containing protein [Acidimicrobiia bacterium]|nr:DUF1932 domain-containing protein [Acidimicrobiia bacterium]
MAADVLFLHPGAMGARLAGSCRGAGRRLWLPDSRSDATTARAEREGLEAVETLGAAVARADIVVSICPPSAADSVADHVASAGFDGVYVDANAIAPTKARRIGRRFDRFIDGGIIGPPPTEPGTTRLYLSGRGDDPHDVAALWSGSELDARVIDGDIGAASALKMTYAAWTKGSAALLATIVAGADAMGVGDDLEREWDLSQPGLGERVQRTAAAVGPKAWRFTGEMTEIASTFADIGLPAGFWTAAAETYGRLAPLKEVDESTVDALVELLRSESS